MTEVAVEPSTGLVKKIPKNATPEDVAKIYMELEKQSLTRSTGKGVLGISSKDIRDTIKEIGMPRMLLSAVLKLIAQDHKLENNKQQLRMRIIGAVQTKDSGIELERDEDGRVWILVK